MKGSKLLKIADIPEFTVTIDKFSHDGRGIARVDGKTTFVQGALPNEVVSCKYIKRKGSFDEGRTVAVQVPSPHRVPALCSHFESCGGCSLQHLNSKMQIQEKQALFLEILERIGHCKPDNVLPPLEGPLWHYRQKARISVRYSEKTGKLFLGFRERHNPRKINDTIHCPILNAKVDEQLPRLRELIQSFDAPDRIAQIEVAAGDEDVALIFRNMTPLSPQDEVILTTFGEESGFRIYLQSGGPSTVTLFYPQGLVNEEVYIKYRLPSENITFLFDPTDFTQINAGLNQLMVPLALDLLALNENDRVLDLYCGLGNFSLPLAKRCQKVIGVEGSETMVERARMNANNNGLYNLEFMSANLEDAAAWDILRKHPINKLLLDPPRVGALEIVKNIELLDPECIVYVSCNPATLARDAGILVNEKGYKLRKAGVMDMFPHTSHVESIALFEK